MTEGDLKELQERVSGLEVKVAGTERLVDQKLAAAEVLNQTKFTNAEKLVDLVKSVNGDLMTQLRTRWGPFQIYGALLALLFTLCFGYQLFKTEENRRLTNKLEQASDLLETQTRATASVLSAVSGAAALLHNGLREFERGEYEDARDYARSANDLLAGCKRQLKTLQTNSPLMEPILQAQVSALALVARTSFYLEDVEGLKAASSEIQSVDPTAWEGYHFMGLAIGFKPTDNESVLREIIDQYERSIKEHPKRNKDYLNLAEIYMFIGQFANSSARAERYLKDRPNVQNASTFLLEGYYAAANYLNDQLASPDRLEDSLKKLNTYPNGPLKGFWDPTFLDAIVHKLDSPPKGSPFGDVEPARRLKAAQFLSTLKKKAIER
ncbi:MAG TPA: hypothetical protein VL361_25450 [Candidatus Limnocylindrales bacterium]|jgi:hypothetical protein|nr:hypothetical protein [Candidatus Limnocylindrales bacterium]